MFLLRGKLLSNAFLFDLPIKAGPAADALREHRLDPDAVSWLQTNFLKTAILVPLATRTNCPVWSRSASIATGCGAETGPSNPAAIRHMPA